MKTGTFIDIDELSAEAYDAAIDDTCPDEGLLITSGYDSAAVILEAFPSGGYTMADAYELRDLILKFNKEHFLVPMVL